MIKLIIDAMGGDNAPGAIVDGAVSSLEKFSDIELILTGKKAEIEQILGGKANPRLSIIDCSEVIENCESPTEAIRKKPDSSLVVGFNLLRDGRGDALISAGSTGAVIAGGTLIVRRAKGIKRPALAPVMPNGKSGVLLIDCGANVDSKPQFLAQFGVMGSVYMEKVAGVKNPKVGLINNGAEAQKGNELTKEAYKLLSVAPINFIGNVEGRDILTACDVAVCDGFTGNVVMKFMEGVGGALMAMLKEELMGSLQCKIGAKLAMPAFRAFRAKTDYTEYGGAPLLGTKAPVIKAHGSSNAKAIFSTIRQAREFVISGVLDSINAEIEKMGDCEP